MKSFTPVSLRALLARSIVAAAAVAACSAASALPSFTFNPAAVQLAGTAFTADNLLVSDFSTVTFTGNGGFQESGYLSITGAQLGGLQVMPQGLNSTYGLYVAFNGSAAQGTSVGDFQFGKLDTLNYTLYGYNGTGTFSPTSAPMPSVTLGSGSLIKGTFNSTTSDSMVTGAGFSTRLTFAESAGSQGFFVAPTPFYGIAEAAFTHTSSQITTTDGGFLITQGGGPINFVAAPVPEPETYALMLGGLAALGFVARRRKNA